MIGLFFLMPFVSFSLSKLHKLLLSRRYCTLPKAVATKELDFEIKNINTQVEDINVWCELDSNLLGEIMSRLCLTDQARFRAVCKKWLAVHPVITTKSLPWYLNFDISLPIVSGMLQVQLYDPLSPNIGLTHNISLTKLGIPSPRSIANTGFTLKNDWFFISVSKPRWFFWTRRYFLLFSVFTRKVITLPKLDYPCRFKFNRMFSTEPDSPDCVFFLLDAVRANKIALITYRMSDKKWTPREFDAVDEFVPCTCHPVYFRGILYIVSPIGQIASYTIVDGEFKFESLLIDELFFKNYYSSRIHEIFELNGELMLIYFGSRKKQNDTFPGKQCIKRYDWSNKVWIPVSTLGDKTLFVSDNICEVAKINGEEMRNSGVLPNKIYYFFDCGCLIYSVEDGELVEFKSIDVNFLEDGAGDLPEYKYNHGITYSGVTKATCWLEPPCVLH